MSYFMKNKYIVGLIIITIIIFVLMGLSTIDRSKTPMVENVIGVVISPVQNVFSSVGNYIENLAQFVFDMKTLKQQNEELSKKVDQLEQDNRGIQELQDENQRLRELMELKQKQKQFDTIGADIIAKEPGNWFNAFTIDKGTANGLQKKCAVITSKGLVGYIYDIGSNWAKVIAIIDPDSSAGGTIVRTRDSAVVKGDVNLEKDGLCKMTYLSKEADIISGDLIETSGLGGIYPKGLLIGKVGEIKPEEQGISQYAIIEPAVDFERLKEVLVIRSVENTMQ